MRLRSEIGVFLSIAATLFLVINNTMTISSMSNRTQEIEDNVFPSLQKMEDAMKVLDEVQKSLLKELEDQCNEFDKRLNYFEKQNSIFNKPSNKEKMFSTNVDKFVKTKIVKEIKEKKNQKRKLAKD